MATIHDSITSILFKNKMLPNKYEFKSVPNPPRMLLKNVANAIGFNQPLLPTVSVSRNPGDGVPDGDYLIFEHRESTAAAAGSVIGVEYSPDPKDPWTGAIDGVDGVVVVETPDAHAPGIARVETFIPISSPRVFARLRVFIP